MLRGLTLLSLFAALIAGNANAETIKVGHLVVEAPWARATIGQGRTGVAYLTIVNRGAEDDRLVGAETPVANRAGLHTHKVEGGVMKMRPVDGIAVKAGTSTVLKPGALHVMMMGLKAPLKEGGSFPMILTFEKAGHVEVQVQIAKATAKQADGMQGHGHHGKAEKMGHGHAGQGHDHGKVIDLAAGPKVPTLDFTIAKDAAGGWNLHIVTENFHFAPEHVNGAHRSGEGHAHIYVNGTKLARIYGPWYHIAALPKGANAVMVTLNANDHRALAVDGKPLAKTMHLHLH